MRASKKTGSREVKSVHKERGNQREVATGVTCSLCLLTNFCRGIQQVIHSVSKLCIAAFKAKGKDESSVFFFFLCRKNLHLRYFDEKQKMDYTGPGKRTKNIYWTVLIKVH